MDEQYVDAELAAAQLRVDDVVVQHGARRQGVQRTARSFGWR